jgi:hypothetical protein
MPGVLDRPAEFISASLAKHADKFETCFSEGGKHARRPGDTETSSG